MPKSREFDFQNAIASFRAGQFKDAERQLKKVLLHQPKHIGALHLLGALLTHLERYAEAERCIRSVLELDASSDVTLYNYGIVLKALKRPQEALQRFEQALTINPAIAETWNNCGTALNDLDRYGDAIERFDKAIALRPGYIDARYNRGKSLIGLGRFEDAVAEFDLALTSKPDLAEAWHARGVALSNLARDDDAYVAFQRAHLLKPHLLDAASALVTRLLSEGKLAEALELARRALAANDTPEAKRLVGLCLSSPLLHPDLGDLRELLSQALSEAWAQLPELAPACARFLGLNHALQNNIAQVAAAWPNLPAEPANSPDFADIAEDRLLRTLLESVPVCSVDLERFTTRLRLGLLTAATSAAQTGKRVLSMYCAVARQSFVNDYVFAHSDQEITQVSELCEAITTALASGSAIPALSLVAVAAYLRLRTLPGAESLLRRSWPEPVNAVLAQQISAPLEEQRLHATIPALTTIDDDVSVQVRQQYEENPYPNWSKLTLAGTPRTVNALMREKFPASAFVPLQNSDNPAVMVAGCGTGRHAIDAARRFKSARVLAIDISLNSLYYAQRQTREFGFNNIEYAQADIMKLGSLERTFDVIESCGVLHHLADPFAGWRILLSLLRPGGVMLLGFYSEIARRDIVAARAFIAERGYQATADDIRRCRQELFDRADNDSSLKHVTQMADFFNLSECRDLLFHVQEHRFNLLQIAAFLDDNGLQFLGFDIDLANRRRYASLFPDDTAMADLNLWHRYEVDHPYTFFGMYNFWVQKKATGIGNDARTASIWRKLKTAPP